MSYLVLFEKYEGKLRNDKWYRMLCPFHADRSPSLDVDITKPGFKCWSCGKTGNYVDLISELEGVSPMTAAAMVASYRPANILGFQGRLGKIEKKHFLNKEILEKFVPLCNNSREAEYLKNRGIDLKIVKKFDLRTGTALERGWENRIIFPIVDIDGYLCSIEGRDITGSAYLRYRKWEGSHSGNGIFGINVLPKRLWGSTIIIVEGAIDCISVWQCGYPALGLSCSDVTDLQLNQIKKITESVVIILDGVKPGTEDSRVEVLHRLTKNFKAKIKNCKVIEISEIDTDPNDLLVKGKLKSFLRKLNSERKKIS